MVDMFSPSQRSRIMRLITSKNTTPEIAVRKLLFAMGLRFRLHRRDLPGCPDIVLVSRRIAIFVNGCFWHGHTCRDGRVPKSNIDYWAQKIDRNRARDRRTLKQIRALGWRPVVLWSCTCSDVDRLKRRLTRAIGVKTL